MKKAIFIFSLVLLASAAVVSADDLKGERQQGSGLIESEQVVAVEPIQDNGDAGAKNTGQGQQVQVKTQTQAQIQTQAQAQEPTGDQEPKRIREQVMTEQQTREGVLSEGNLIENQVRAKNFQELKNIIKNRQQELEGETAKLKNKIKEVYKNQNEVRLAVHSLLATEDLAGGIGKQISAIAKEFNNSVQATIKAEEKIQTRNIFKKWFAGGDKEAAKTIDGEALMNQQRIENIKQLLEECDCTEELKTTLREQVTNLEEQQTRLKSLAQEELSKVGVWGWVKNWFKK